MMEPTISVIVPVYNSEKTLRRCIDSILSQTYSSFELLVIDDGSTDQSPQICDEYLKLDNRIKVFHKKNGGASSARNIGLSHATGQWITFADSDDMVLDNWLQIFIDGLSGEEELLVQGMDILEFPYEKKNLKHYGINYSGNVAVGVMTIPGLGYTVCKLFRKDIIDTNNLRFNTNFKVYEDEDFVLKYMCNVKHMLSVEQGTYQYYMPNWKRKYGIQDDFYCNISRLSSIRKILLDQPCEILYLFIYRTCFSYIWSMRHRTKEIATRSKVFFSSMKGILHLCPKAAFSVYKERHMQQ